MTKELDTGHIAVDRSPQIGESKDGWADLSAERVVATAKNDDNEREKAMSQSEPQAAHTTHTDGCE